MFRIWRAWLARVQHRRAGRARTLKGWMDSPCDYCTALLETPVYAIRTGRGRFLMVCAPCCGDLRAAGAQLMRVLT